MEDVWLQHVAALAHFALTVCEILSKHYPGRWTDCGSPTSPVPLSWPPRSPELPTPDNSLQEIIKRQVAVHCYHNTELCKAMEQAFTIIMP
jgi:hypothetical protein